MDQISKELRSMSNGEHVIYDMHARAVSILPWSHVHIHEYAYGEVVSARKR